MEEISFQSAKERGSNFTCPHFEAFIFCCLNSIWANLSFTLQILVPGACGFFQNYIELSMNKALTSLG
jgi:hypothetical protein